MKSHENMSSSGVGTHGQIATMKNFCVIFSNSFYVSFSSYFYTFLNYQLHKTEIEELSSMPSYLQGRVK
jgi:hypothetical protein